ncbi:MAG: hypothetical protein QNK37_11375 [Acidobacteriota bacterium]|nr:hypothetical protein [Acidobacteriota bacterium]
MKKIKTSIAIVDHLYSVFMMITPIALLGVCLEWGWNKFISDFAPGLVSSNDLSNDVPTIDFIFVVAMGYLFVLSFKLSWALFQEVRTKLKDEEWT